MLELARTFPCLAGFYAHAGADWDPDRLSQACGKFAGGESAAACFLLNLWNPRCKWKCGKFNFIDAASKLDAGDREAMAAWVKNPWWP